MEVNRQNHVHRIFFGGRAQIPFDSNWEGATADNDIVAIRQIPGLKSIQPFRYLV